MQIIRDIFDLYNQLGVVLGYKGRPIAWRGEGYYLLRQCWVMIEDADDFNVIRFNLCDDQYQEGSLNFVYLQEVQKLYK